jgi:nucleoid-associated protein YgaU
MAAASMSRMVLPIAYVAACVMAFVTLQHVRREPPDDSKAATTSKPISGVRDQDPAAFASAQATANAVPFAVGGSAVPPESDDGLPAFDIARIEPTGEAVIAGRAAPGATVELLRDGESYDRAVADRSGQFVMVPPRLPSGRYDLSLRTKQPDGKQATSKHTVAVVLELNPNDQPFVALMRPDKPTVVLPQPVAPKISPGIVVVDAVETEPGGTLHASASERRSDITPAQPAQLAAAVGAILPDGGSSSVIVPKIATTTVSRGDNLWRLSRLTYGLGTRYAVIYKANREQIRNPNRIYPGQIFVLPSQ